MSTTAPIVHCAKCGRPLDAVCYWQDGKRYHSQCLPAPMTAPVPSDIDGPAGEDWHDGLADAIERLGPDPVPAGEAGDLIERLNEWVRGQWLSLSHAHVELIREAASALAAYQARLTDLACAADEVLKTTPDERQNPAVWIPRVDRLKAIIATIKMPWE